MAFTYEDFVYDPTKVTLDKALQGTSQVAGQTWAQYYLGEDTKRGGGLFQKSGADNPYYLAFSERIKKLQEAGAGEDVLSNLSSIQSELLAAGGGGSAIGGNLAMVNSITNDWGASDYGESQKIKQWGTPENERAAAEAKDAKAAQYSDLYQKFYMAEANFYEEQNQRKVYDAERNLAAGKYEQEQQQRVFAEQQEKAKQQQILFSNQRDLQRVNTETGADVGTGLASRLLGGTALEEGRASSAEGMASSVGFNTAPDEELRRKRGLSSAVGINL